LRMSVSCKRLKPRILKPRASHHVLSVPLTVARKFVRAARSNKCHTPTRAYTPCLLLTTPPLLFVAHSRATPLRVRAALEQEAPP